MPAGAVCMRKVERGGHGNGEALPQKVPCLGAVLGCGAWVPAEGLCPQPLIIGAAVLPSFCIQSATLVKTCVLPTSVTSR